MSVGGPRTLRLVAPVALVALVAALTGAAALVMACNALTGISDFETAPEEMDADTESAPDGQDEEAALDASDGSLDGGDAADAMDATPLPKRVFVTNTTSTGSFGGLSGANTFCNIAAQEADAGPGAKFIAWLSNGTVDAIANIPDAGPWLHFDRSQTVFPSRAHIASGSPALAPLRTERGTMPGLAWTGSSNNGKKAGPYCTDWGSSSAVDFGAVGTPAQPMRWSANPDYPAQTCNNGYGLICFEK